MLHISLIFCIFAPLKKENDMAEIANRIYETSEGQILFISDFSDINDNEKVVSRALSVEEKKGNIVRLANGVYLRPKNTRFGIVYPSIDEMVIRYKYNLQELQRSTNLDSQHRCLQNILI